jgi:hypothetical protein
MVRIPTKVEHLDASALRAGLSVVRGSPSDLGTVEMIVRRPAVDQREIVAEVVLDVDEGVVGDNWRIRGSKSTPDGAADPGAQVTLMNARFATLIAGDPARRQLAGDQLFVDFDLCCENVPVGSLLAIGSVVIEVSDKPHTGCQKFAARFGREALRFVNSEVGRSLNLRGLNAKIVVGGVVRTGDPVRKMDPT